MKYSLAILCLALTRVLGNSASKSDEEETEAIVIFNPPKHAPGAVFFDTFQDGLKKWTHTAHPDFTGEFSVERGGQNTHEEMSEELELLVTEEAAKYGLVSTRKVDLDTSDGFVFQYEVRLHDGITCGGAYIKLLGVEASPEEFNDKTRYSVMFGPDKCGSTNKVHLITQVFNPSSQEWVEHHLKDPPKVKTDKKTHLYTLVVDKGQQQYEILIDNESKKEGNFNDDFEPPIQPLEEIDDPEDEKPEDWVDEKKIDDPNAEKPDDWDEDAPAKIEDPEASKPECWHDDALETIPDPDAGKPEGWDEEDDGVFEAPVIDNPICTDECGCGEWVHPMISNPDYKGKWKAPKIDNPDYIGEWKPQKITNPAYYIHSPTDRKVSDIKGIAIDIWTMNKDVGFDNIYLGIDKSDAFSFSQQSWKPKNEHETKIAKKKKDKDGGWKNGFVDMIMQLKDFVSDYIPQFVFTTIILVVSISWWCCRKSDPPAAAHTSVRTGVDVLQEETQEDGKEDIDGKKTESDANDSTKTPTPQFTEKEQ